MVWFQGLRQFVRSVKFHPVTQGQVHLKTKALMNLLNTTSFSQCLIFSNYTVKQSSVDLNDSVT